VRKQGKIFHILRKKYYFELVSKDKLNDCVLVNSKTRNGFDFMRIEEIWKEDEKGMFGGYCFLYGNSLHFNHYVSQPRELFLCDYWKTYPIDQVLRHCMIKKKE